MTYPNATQEYYSQWGQSTSDSDCFVIAPNQTVCRSAPLIRADHVENITLRGGPPSPLPPTPRLPHAHYPSYARTLPPPAPRGWPSCPDPPSRGVVGAGGQIRGSGPQLWYNSTPKAAGGPWPFTYAFWHMCRPLLVSTNNLRNLRVDNISLLDGPYIHFGADAGMYFLCHALFLKLCER